MPAPHQPSEKDDITLLLGRAASGNSQAREALMTSLYQHLRSIAQRQMAGERAGHTLSATALVHEAFLKLVSQQRLVAATDRAHFLALAAMAMRRVLVSHARKRAAGKRGGGQRAITLDEVAGQGGLPVEDMLALDAALERLRALSERQAAVVAYRAFAAMTDAEIATVLKVSVPTVRRDYRLAAAWLRRELSS